MPRSFAAMVVSGYSTEELYVLGASFRMSAPSRVSKTGLSHVVHDGAGAHDRGIQAGEPAKDLLALLLLGDAGEQSIGLKVVHAGDRDARHGQRTEQGRPEADGSQNVFFVGVDVTGGAAQPALGAELVRLAGVPDVHGPEVGPRGVGIADAVDDTQRTLFVKGLDGTHLGVQRSLVIQAEFLPSGMPTAGRLSRYKGLE